jgi:hypothetical protein
MVGFMLAPYKRRLNDPNVEYAELNGLFKALKTTAKEITAK